MEYTDKPVWTFFPDWDSGVLERLEWLTDVLTSSTGAEQRISKRISPRRSFEVTIVLAYQDRQYFENQMSLNMAKEWLVPIWHDVAKTTAPIDVGADMIPVDTALREYVAGDYVLLRGANARSYEVAQIDSIESDGLKLISNNLQAWPSGTKVYPLRTGRIDALTNGFTLTKMTDVLVSSAMTFTLTGPNDFAPSFELEPSMYNGVGVVNVRPDESNDLTMTYLSLLQMVDGDQGLREYFDPSGVTFVQQQYAWALVGREQQYKLRQLFYALQGRLHSVWIPTFMQDFDIVADIKPNDQAITVRNTGYAALGILNTPGKTDIRIEFRDGSFMYTKIIAAVELDGDREVLGLYDAFPAAIPASFIKSISYMVIARMDSDTIEINHDTDVDGLTRVTTTWRSSPVERDAEEWIPLPFPNAVMSAIQLYCSCNCSPFDTMSYADGRVPLMPNLSDSIDDWIAWYDALPSDMKGTQTGAQIQATVKAGAPETVFAALSVEYGGSFTPAWFTVQEQSTPWLAYNVNYSDPVDFSQIATYYDMITRNALFAAIKTPSGGLVLPPTRQSMGVPDSATGIRSEACVQLQQTNVEVNSVTVPGHISEFRVGVSPVYANMAILLASCTSAATGFPAVPLSNQSLDIGTAIMEMAFRVSANPAADTVQPRNGAHLIMYGEGHESLQAFSTSGEQYYYGPQYSGTVPVPNPSAGFMETWIHTAWAIWIDDAPWPAAVSVEVRDEAQSTEWIVTMQTVSTQLPDGRYGIAGIWTDGQYASYGSYTANPKAGQFQSPAAGRTVVVRVN